MTLDEAREVLRTFSFLGSVGENDVQVLDITPRTHPGLFNSLVSLTYPDVDPGKLTDRELEAIRVFVGQWSEEEAMALITATYLEMASHVD